jgi:hypothetical protein
MTVEQLTAALLALGRLFDETVGVEPEAALAILDAWGLVIEELGVRAFEPALGADEARAHVRRVQRGHRRDHH